MQTAVQDVTLTTIPEETVETSQVSAELNDIVIGFENFLTETVKNANTFRQKREKTFLDIKAAVINYLDTLKAENKIADYSLELSQSGVKKMGIYVVGEVTFTSTESEYTVKIKNKMNTWNFSGETFKAEETETVEVPATEEPAVETEVTGS